MPPDGAVGPDVVVALNVCPIPPVAGGFDHYRILPKDGRQFQALNSIRSTSDGPRLRLPDDRGSSCNGFSRSPGSETFAQGDCWILRIAKWNFCVNDLVGSSKPKPCPKLCLYIWRAMEGIELLSVLILVA